LTNIWNDYRKKRRNWTLNMNDSLTVFVLYGCNLSKERGSMRVVAATTDEEMLHREQ